jgi:serine/threonine-protein kinase
MAVLFLVGLVAALAVMPLTKPRETVVQPIVVVPAPAKPSPEPEKPPEPTAQEPAKSVEAPPPEAKPRPKAVAKGKLTIDSVPWSEVFLNGKKLGDTPLVDYPMPAGVHVLKLVNDDKGVKSSIEVEILAGKTTVKKLKL